MKVLRISLIAFALAAFFASAATAQDKDPCATWNNSPKKEEAENAHVLYRGVVKGKDVAGLEQLGQQEFDLAYNNWKKAYDIAPAADGQRPSHYSDGRDLLKVKYNKATDPAQKKEFADIILRLFDEQMKCYQNEGFLLGRKGFEMFYMPEYGYRQETYNTLKQALEKGGNETEYIVMEPMSQILVYFFQNQMVSQKETQDIYNKMTEIVDYNIEHNDRYGKYYEDIKLRMASHFKAIEDEVFDCAYFKTKLLPDYQAKPNDLKIVQYTYVKLKQQGCDTTEAIMQELKGKYEVIARAINDSLEVVRRQQNPCYDASQLQQEGNYSRALERYEECLKATDDPDAKAQVYYSIASIRLYRMSQEGAAISAARQAAALKSGWGRPYIIIGDAYAKLGRDCGDDWTTRLAVLAAMDKYGYAKAIDSDPDLVSDANRRLGQYRDAMPERQEGFMRGIKEGQSVNVGCGIGETVKVRYKD
ncbi:MAG: hypothetical protein KDC66_18565 [Phaeodactylibacter sp.]|nr:hypothetical protein [Phaeodactylibacter sp.]MCB9276704.1 hypothetical protein [Lewinellaceae bacterium]